jgi:hypothetical protein
MPVVTGHSLLIHGGQCDGYTTVASLLLRAIYFLEVEIHGRCTYNI